MIVFFLQLNEDGSGDNWGAGDIPEISEFFLEKSEIPFSSVMNINYKADFLRQPHGQHHCDNHQDGK